MNLIIYETVLEICLKEIHKNRIISHVNKKKFLTLKTVGVKYISWHHMKHIVVIGQYQRSKIDYEI